MKRPGYILIIVLFMLVVLTKGWSLEKYRVGLALSGGGAKGIAHIGVLKVLEKEGIPVHLVSGNSMGSIIGALYASGYSAAQMERIIRSQNWQQILTDSLSRNDLSMEDKHEEGRYVLNLPVSGLKVGRVKGIISGHRIMNTFSRYTVGVHSIHDFSELPIPFTCVATDLETGEMVVLDHGDLPEALRASMAIPTVFTPIVINNRMLVDGGVVNSFPVRQLKKMGADVIIGIDVVGDLYTKEELDSINKIIDQTVKIHGKKLRREQGELCDVLLKVDTRGYSASDFRKFDALIKIGEQAAMAKIHELRALKRELQLEDTAATMYDPTIFLKKKYFISRIQVGGLKDVSRELLMGKLQISQGDEVTIDDIERAVNRAYGSRFFNSVTWRLEPYENGNLLRIMVNEGVADQLRFGIRYDDVRKAALLVNATFRNKFIQGSRISLDTRLSENPFVEGSYFVYTGGLLRVGLGLSGWAERQDVYTYVDGDISSSYRYYDYGGQLQLQSIIHNHLAIGGLVEKEYTEIEPEIGSSSEVDQLERTEFQYMNFAAFIKIDTLDRSAYPRRGLLIEGEARTITGWASTVPQEHGPFYSYSCMLNGYIPIHSRISLQGGYQVGILQGDDVTFDKLFYFGGLTPFDDNVFPFIGSRYLEVSARNMQVLSGGIQVEPWRNIFIQLRGNAGQVSSETGNLFKNEEFEYGYGLTIGWLSPIGPADVTVMHGSIRDEILGAVNIGYQF